MNKCPDCNIEFECGANKTEPCWCCSLPNIVPLDSQNCLCPECLKKKIIKLQLNKYGNLDYLRNFINGICRLNRCAC